MVINTNSFKWLGSLSNNWWPGISCLHFDPSFWIPCFLYIAGRFSGWGVAGPSLWETHLSDAAGMCALHGLNWKHPETHNSLGNQDVTQLPLGQGLCGQHIKLHPYYPLVWMKGFLGRMKRFMSWNEKLKPPLNGQDHNNVVNKIGLTLT